LLAAGRVLITGGSPDGYCCSTTGGLASAEIYDPATGKFTAAGSMNQARTGQSATLLGDGRVLVVGGVANYAPFGSAEIYDPATGKFTITGSLRTARIGDALVLLQDGRALVVGGYDANGVFVGPAELYDPATGKFAATGSLDGRSYPGVVVLQDGRVLVAGGDSTGASAELYQP
jgi:hypothetical protein